ncbi:DEKNAAC102855 [Brettanomyces naardenensis]|uniref:Serine/threonine-protein phosphatase n=1 Tax=Brettanomyces naardenensis TaxID=13370 RepID=A0A448YLY5_BRENA|nr:DEKNAAC102855 [Brettanomyces naardenensis]
MLDLDQCLEKLYQGQLLSEPVIEQLCFKLKELLIKDSNIVHISSPITLVGDIHGQFYDLLEIFKIGGYPPDTNYLFLGDYVDRGYHSVETISLLIVLKLKYPSRVTLIRGNHESRQITTNYGFYTECATKYGQESKVWKLFTDLFDFLVLAAVVDDTLFCVHGGLSPNVQTIDSILVIDRFREIPHDGPMADLVWSDPDIELLNFRISSRGAGYQFGVNVVNRFLQLNGFERIYRAHQLCNEGYQVFWKGKVNTVWSAPNYCYRCGNKASILEIFDRLSSDPKGFRFNVFDASPDSEKEFIQLENGDGEFSYGEDGGEGWPAVPENRLMKKAPYVEYFM